MTNTYTQAAMKAMSLVGLMTLALLIGAGHAQAQSKPSPTQSGSAKSSVADHESRREKFKHMCANPTPSQRDSLEMWAKALDKTLGPDFCYQVELYYLGTKSRPQDMRYLATTGRDGMRDISVFQYFTGLKSFGVGGEVQDLSPLIHLNSLTDLGVGANKHIVDISVVSHLKNLKHLSLADTQVISLEPLAALSNLETLNLAQEKGSPKRTGIEVLRNLKNLVNLKIDTDEPIGDQLREMKELQSLFIVGPVSDVCNFQHLSNLTGLYLLKSNVENLSCLKRLNQLYALALDASPVKDVSALASLPKLKILSLRNTLVTDLSAFTIQNNVTIGSIDATGAPLRWCSPKTAEDVKKGISCLNPDGTEKPWWKRALRR